MIVIILLYAVRISQNINEAYYANLEAKNIDYCGVLLLAFSLDFEA
ncbi:hypothetical protein BH18THE1_BH18THE1_15970 [soil metagenome]